MTRRKKQETRIRALKGRLHLNKRDYQTLLHLTTLSRRLHDKTVQIIQQTGTKNYNKLYHILKKTPEYQLLPSQPAQQTIKLALQSYKRHKKYNPGRRATQVLIFPAQQFRVKGRYILLNLGKNYQKAYGRRIPGNGHVDRPVRVRIPWGPFSNRLEEFRTLWDSVILHEAPSDREG